MVQAQAQHFVALLHQPIQAHRQLLATHQAQDLLDVQHRYPRIEVVAIARGETGPEFVGIALALLLPELLHQAIAQAVLPGQRRLDDLVLYLSGVEFAPGLGVDPQHEMHPHQNRFGKMRGELGFLGREGVTEDMLDLLALLGGVAIPGYVDHAVDKFPVGIAAHEQARLAALLDAIDRGNRVEQLLYAGLEQFIPREQFEYPHQFPALVVG